MAGIPFVQKFFVSDRPAREAYTLLRPHFRSVDLVGLNHEELQYMGGRIADWGDTLANEGNFPGQTCFAYQYELSLEVADSIKLWREALEAPSSSSFLDLARRAAAQAEAGYCFLGSMGPRLAAIRWCCCLYWIAVRAAAVDEVSAGGSFGTVKNAANYDALRKAKSQIFDWLRALMNNAPILALYDFDLVGYGVFIDRRCEPMPKHGDNEWFRRSTEYDIVCLARQALELPPEDINAVSPTFLILRPHGELDWELRPLQAPRHIVERHNWGCEIVMPKIDAMPSKALVQGRILEIDRPPEPEFDLADPEVVSKILAGIDLGKGDQADGLPGSIHGSVGLLFAALVGAEGLDNVRIRHDMLEIDGFLDAFLRHSTGLRSLDLSGSAGSLEVDHIKLLHLAGKSLTNLDLDGCGIDDDFVDAIADALCTLPNVQHLDLGNNNLHAAAATRLVAACAERRVDLMTLRLNGNPLGELGLFRNEVAALVACRGEQTVCGGELVLHFGDCGVHWQKESRPGSLAARTRDEDPTLSAMAVEEISTSVDAKERHLDELEAQAVAEETSAIEQRRLLDEHDPTRVRATDSSVNRLQIEMDRKMNALVLRIPMMQAYREKVALLGGSTTSQLGSSEAPVDSM